MANAPGPDLSGLLLEMLNDRPMWDSLVCNGYVQFGKAADLNYDPVCFALKRRLIDADCSIVQIDHEEILCNDRVREVREIASSFRQLILQTIEDAARSSLLKPVRPQSLE